MKTELSEIITEIKLLEKERTKNNEEIKKLEHQLFKELCRKNYLKECEPAYCFFNITGTCEYIKVMNEIHNRKDESDE